jgi:hypothetical protein
MKGKCLLRRTVHAPDDGDDKYLNTEFECTSAAISTIGTVVMRLHLFKIVCSAGGTKSVDTT